MTHTEPTHFAPDLFDLLRLYIPYPTKIEVVQCGPDEPERWAVWCGERGNEDIIGAGRTRDRALRDAIKTARGWEK